MKPVFEKVPRARGNSFACEIVRGQDFGTPWHFHPEYEITLTIEATGHRIVGDNIRSLEAGDLVLLGSGLTHVWQADGARGPNPVHAIVIQFRDDFLGPGFFEAGELRAIRQLLDRSSLGLEILGRARDEVGGMVRTLPEATGAERVIRLLTILDALARTDAVRPISSAGFAPSLDRFDEARVNRVCQYINQNLADPITRTELARLIHFSEGAFSRFFKTRTGKTLPTFINELRIGRACRRLADDPETSVTDIAFDCGFTNLSNFNRQFQRFQHCTPRSYRDRLRRASPDS
ncbi:AraC family transcriptional regulator [soil metagenome]